MLERELKHNEEVVNEVGNTQVRKFDSRTKMWVTLQFLGDSEDDGHTVERAREITVQTLTNTG